MSQLEHAGSEHAHWRHMPPGSEAYERVLEDLRGVDDRPSASSFYPSSSPSCIVAPSRQLYNTTVLAELRASDNEESCGSKALTAGPRQDRFPDNGREQSALKSRTAISHHGDHIGCQTVSVVVVRNDPRNKLRTEECSGSKQFPVPCAKQDRTQLAERGEGCDFIDELIPPMNGFNSPHVMGTNSSLLLDRPQSNVAHLRDKDPPAPAILKKSKSFSKPAHAKGAVGSKQHVSAAQISAEHAASSPSDRRDLVSRHVIVCRTSLGHGPEHSPDKDENPRSHSRVPLSRHARKPECSGSESPSLPDETRSLSLADRENEHVDGDGDNCDHGPRARRRSHNISLRQEAAGRDGFERDETPRARSTSPAGSRQWEGSREVDENDSGASVRSPASQAVTVRPPQQHNLVSSSNKVLPPPPATHPAHLRLSRTNSPKERAVRPAEGDDFKGSSTTTTAITVNGGGEAERDGAQGPTTSHFRQRSLSDASVHLRPRRLSRSPRLAHHVLEEDVHAHVRWADEEKGSPLATSVLLSSLRPRAFSHGSVDMPPKPILKKPAGF